MQPSTVPSSAGSLAMYLAEINRYPLLTVDEEQRLARLYAKNGDLDAAHKLVTSNLRFVVKVAYEYRSYGIKMADLIQEGNIGLMKAVQKFDADKGIRLISYAVWWIRAFIQNHILKSWSLVKLGTTQAQRKLFFSLARTRRELEKFDGTEQARTAGPPTSTSSWTAPIYPTRSSRSRRSATSSRSACWRPSPAWTRASATSSRCASCRTSR